MSKHNISPNLLTFITYSIHLDSVTKKFLSTPIQFTDLEEKSIEWINFLLHQAHWRDRSVSDIDGNNQNVFSYIANTMHNLKTYQDDANSFKKMGVTIENYTKLIKTLNGHGINHSEVYVSSEKKQIISEALGKIDSNTSNEEATSTNHNLDLSFKIHSIYHNPPICIKDLEKYSIEWVNFLLYQAQWRDRPINDIDGNGHNALWYIINTISNLENNLSSTDSSTRTHGTINDYTELAEILNKNGIDYPPIKSISAAKEQIIPEATTNNLYHKEAIEITDGLFADKSTISGSQHLCPAINEFGGGVIRNISTINNNTKIHSSFYLVPDDVRDNENSREENLSSLSENIGSAKMQDHDSIAFLIIARNHAVGLYLNFNEKTFYYIDTIGGYGGTNFIKDLIPRLIDSKVSLGYRANDELSFVNIFDKTNNLQHDGLSCSYLVSYVLACLIDGVKNFSHNISNSTESKQLGSIIKNMVDCYSPEKVPLHKLCEEIRGESSYIDEIAGESSYIDEIDFC